jgi:hypothetical protein
MQQTSYDLSLSLSLYIYIYIYIYIYNDIHPVTKTFTPLHYTSPNYYSHHFTTLVGTSRLAI